MPIQGRSLKNKEIEVFRDVWVISRIFFNGAMLTKHQGYFYKNQQFQRLESKDIRKIFLGIFLGTSGRVSPGYFSWTEKCCEEFLGFF